MKKNNYVKLAQQFRKQVIKDFGQKCKEFSLGCISCQIHRVIDNLEEIGQFIEDLDKNEKKEKHQKHQKH